MWSLVLRLGGGRHSPAIVSTRRLNPFRRHRTYDHEKLASGDKVRVRPPQSPSLAFDITKRPVRPVRIDQRPAIWSPSSLSSPS
jgi:hypothetical protein